MEHTKNIYTKYINALQLESNVDNHIEVLFHLYTQLHTHTNTRKLFSPVFSPDNELICSLQGKLVLSLRLAV